MSDTSLPFNVGAVATAWSSADLGKKYVVGDKVYRLVMAAAAIATGSGGLLYYTANTAGVPNYKATAPTSNGQYREVGVLATNYNTKAIASSDFFLLQIAGPCTFKVTATTVATKAWLRIASDGKAGTVGTTLGTYPNLFQATNSNACYSTILKVVGFVEDADVSSTTDSVSGYLCRPCLGTI